MKNARSTKAESSVTREGAQTIRPGRLPAKQNTVTAEVLCRLLNHERLTGMDAVIDASTTRLAARIHYLKGYGWHIESVDKVVGCKDGRIATVSEYWLSGKTIEAAMADGAGSWCEAVRAARKALRSKAAQAKRDAERTNAALRARRASHPGQQWLFEGAAHG